MNQLGTIKKAHIVWIFVTDVEIEFRNIMYMCKYEQALYGECESINFLACSGSNTFEHFHEKSF